MDIPKTLKEFSVQLVFSDAATRLVFRDAFYEFYTIALLPYMLGVPPDQVTLYLRDELYGFGDDLIDLEAEGMTVDSEKMLPAAYKNYFTTVYRQHTVAIADLHGKDLNLPQCSLRMISGHGFGNFRGGNIAIGRNSIPWPTLGTPATCLTVLDICNAAYAVAHMEGKQPKKRQWHRFNKVTLFEDDNNVVPTICDKNDLTYAFRVGHHGQGQLASPEEGTKRMSKAVGDSVAASLLVAIKQFRDADGAESLDQLFCENFGTISTNLILHEMIQAGYDLEVEKPISPPAPYTKLATFRPFSKARFSQSSMMTFNVPFSGCKRSGF
jgi:hypothetical protein